VLHPSLGRPGSDFDDLAARLAAAGYRTLALDPRGIKASPAPVEADLHDLARDVLQAVDLAGIDRAHFVGHAFGNRVSRCLAADHPGRVLSITLLAAGGKVEADAEARAALRRCFADPMQGAEHLEAVRTAFFAPGNDVPDDWRTGWFPAAAASQSAATRRTNVDDWWGASQMPLLVVQGLQDRIAPPENGRTLARERPNTTLVEIDGAGHALLPEQPQPVAEAVLALLDRLAQ